MFTPKMNDLVTGTSAVRYPLMATSGSMSGVADQIMNGLVILKYSLKALMISVFGTLKPKVTSLILMLSVDFISLLENLSQRYGLFIIGLGNFASVFCGVQ